MTWIRNLVRTLRPCRFSALVLLIGWLVLLAVPQGQDALKRLAEQASGHKGIGAILLFFAATLVWALSTWYWARTILTLRYWRSPLGFRTWLPRILGTLVFLGVSAGLFRAAWTYEVFQSRGPVKVLLLLGSIFLISSVLFFGFITWRRDFLRLVGDAVRHFGRMSGLKVESRLLMKPPPPEQQFPKLPKAARFIAWASLAVCLTLIVLLAIWPVQVGSLLGALQIIFLAAAALGLIGTVLVHYGRRHKRCYVAIILGLAVGFSWINENHQIRLASTEESDPAERELIAQRFMRWDKDLKNAPVFVVSAEGGGIRAAYWTASVLAALQDQNPSFARHVFAISGVSGGSLGAAIFSALVAESARRDDGKLKCGDFTQCVRAIFRHDFLSPAVGMMVGPDLVQRFLPWPFQSLDRSRGLESTWETAWATNVGSDTFSRPFLMLWSGATGLEVPSLVLNGTHVETGRRVLTSNLRQCRTRKGRYSSSGTPTIFTQSLEPTFL